MRVRPDGVEVVPVQPGRQPERVGEVAEALERGTLVAGLAGHGHQRGHVARQRVGIDDHAGSLPHFMPDGVTDRLRAEAARRGPLTVAGSCLAWGGRYAAGRARLGRAPRTFEFDGHALREFHHRYHYTWMNERAAELALAREVVDGVPDADLLEVGNVLAHYIREGHTVVDRYEQAPGVINADVVDLDLEQRFPLIVSISTLEHVGFDEDVTDPDKPARAVEHLRALLAPGGRLWATIPVGYNAEMDARVRDGRLAFDRLRALRRDSHRQGWREVELDQVWDAEYDRLLFSATGLLVCELGAG